MTKAIALLAASLAGAATCLAGAWLGAAGFRWIETHRDIAMLTQPWLFPLILALVALGLMRRRKQARQ